MAHNPTHGEMDRGHLDQMAGQMAKSMANLAKRIHKSWEEARGMVAERGKNLEGGGCVTL